MGFIILWKGFIILSVWVRTWVMCLIRIKALKYLSICLSVLWSFRPSIHPFDCPRIHLSDRPSICLPSIRLSICMWSVSLGVYVCFSVSMSPYLSECPLCLPVCVSACTSVCLPVRLPFCVGMSVCPSVPQFVCHSLHLFSIYLSDYLHVHMSVCTPLNRSACPHVLLSVNPSHCVRLSIWVSVCPSVYLSTCLYVCLCLSTCLSVSMSVSVYMSMCLYLYVYLFVYFTSKKLQRNCPLKSAKILCAEKCEIQFGIQTVKILKKAKWRSHWYVSIHSDGWTKLIDVQRRLRKNKNSIL